MKKSIVEMRKRAEEASQKYPDLVVYVMDKPGKQAVICANDWVYRERILDGWNDVAKYKNGKEIQ